MELKIDLSSIDMQKQKLDTFTEVRVFLLIEEPNNTFDYSKSNLYLDLFSVTTTRGSHNYYTFFQMSKKGTGKICNALKTEYFYRLNTN